MFSTMQLSKVPSPSLPITNANIRHYGVMGIVKREQILKPESSICCGSQNRKHS